MDPITLGIGMTVAGSVAGAAGSIMAGREQSRAAAFEQDQLKIQEQTTRTAAAQAEAKRRQDLNGQIETIQALRGGRGVGLSSPTGMALLEDATSDEEKNIRTERLGYFLKADQSRRAAEFAGDRAKTSLLAGYLGAAESVFSGGTKLSKLAKG